MLFTYRRSRVRFFQCVALAALTSVWAVNASTTLTADFEGTGLLEGTVLTTQISGLTITGGKLVREGAPQIGFGSQYGPDTIDAGACFDNDFLRPTSTATGHIMRIEFDTPTDTLAFTLGDVDPGSIAIEGVEIRAYGSTGLLQTLTIWNDDPDTGDGYGTLVEFNVTGISAVEFENLDSIAYGIDNINLQDCGPPEFVDWISSTSNSVSGTLCGSTVTATGVPRGDLFNPNGTYTGFNEPHFTPSVALTDSIGTQTINGMTWTFSPALTDPTLHVRQLANTTLTFDSPFTVVSSDGDFTFPAPDSIRGISSADDANGSLLFSGTVSEISWTASDANAGDGMWLQLSVASCSVVTDSDDDGVPDEEDNCPSVPNPPAGNPAVQPDLDEDGVGDACDTDADGDGDPGLTDCDDLDPTRYFGAVEICTDGVDNDCDGDVDLDDAGGDCDGDGVPNDDDNCPLNENTSQEDLDDDGLGDVCDDDIDGDGVANGGDNCPLDANAAQDDLDNDGAGDACDADADGDGLDDLNGDLCPGTTTDPEADVPSRGLGKNRWANMDGNAQFDTRGNNPTGRSFTFFDTAGCSCAQIIELCGYGGGHTKFGCSNSVMDWWTGLHDRIGEAPHQCKDD